MLTRVRKWGNSLGLRIPKSLAEKADLREGSIVELAVHEGQIHTLSTLLAKVTKESLHAEDSTGEPQGRESW